MEVGKSSHANSKRISFTQSSCPGGDLGKESHSGEESQLEYLSAQEEYVDDNSSSEFCEQREVGEAEDTALPGDKVPPQTTAGEEDPVQRARDSHSASVKPDGPSLSEDAGPHFRACFPTSRTSTAQVSLCSRAINTDITTMNISGPVGWPCQSCVDAASNTEWSFGAQSSHGQEQWESKLCPCDWKRGTDRPVHLHKPTVKNSVSNCLQTALQRATEVELELLAVHYKLCYQHCLKVYQLALEENTCFARCDEETGLHSSLLLVLEELECNYSRMKMEINMGVPFHALPPLSVEMKFPPLSSSYVPSKLFRRCPGSDGLSGEAKGDLEAPEVQAEEVPVNRDETQSDGAQPSDSASPQTWEGQQKGGDLKCGHSTTEEETECWIDAKEDLTMSDYPVLPEEMTKQQAKQGTGDSREGQTVQSKSEHSPVRVVASSISVSEDTGESSVQKTSASYTIGSSDIFNSPYALNLSSFTKLISRLQSLHPEAGRDKIVEALQQVRKNNKGMLCGLSISTIEERTSAILRKSVPRCGQEKP